MPNLPFSPQQIRAIKQAPKGQLPNFINNAISAAAKNAVTVSQATKNIANKKEVYVSTKPEYRGITYTKYGPLGISLIGGGDNSPAAVRARATEIYKNQKKAGK